MNGGAEKVFEEIMKDGSFRGVGENGYPILVAQVLDLVLLQAARGAEVKISGVFIPKDTVFDFCPLAPAGGAVSIFLTEVRLGKVAKAGFEGERERASSKRSRKEMTARPFLR
jgi:hypothetical protein